MEPLQDFQLKIGLTLYFSSPLYAATGDVHLVHGTVTVNNLPGNINWSMSGINITASEVNGAYPPTATTVDNNGNYSLTVFEGTYNISCSVWLMMNNNNIISFFYSASSNLAVAGDTEFNIIIPAVLLSGVVTDAAGTPVPGTLIQVGIGPGGATTGSDGTYQMPILPGTYTLTVIPPSTLYPPFYLRNVVIFSNLTRNVVFGSFDTDHDGYADDIDAFASDPKEWLDTDGDGIGNNADLDDDNDGMPDIWEILYSGLNPLINDASGDLDGDGVNNLQEFLAGSDPENAPNYDIIELGNLFPWSWYDAREINYARASTSIYGFVRNCLADPAYYFCWCDPPTTDCCTTLSGNQFIREHVSYEDLPVATLDGRPMVTAFLDATWGNSIAAYQAEGNRFNTVFRGYPRPNHKFEVISRIDDFPTPIDGTDNIESYYFTYDDKSDANGVSIEGTEWINYLSAIRTEYGRPIDTLTIFVHARAGVLQMSDRFVIRNDQASQEIMTRLRSETILSPCGSTILLFACEAGQGTEGEEFLQNLADWTGATVYGNSLNTGPLVYDTKTGKLTQDWSLDVIKTPSYGLVACEAPSGEPVRATDDSMFLFPGGIVVEIPSGSLESNGIVYMAKVTDPNTLSEYGVDLTTIENLEFAFDFSITDTVIRDGMDVAIKTSMTDALQNADPTRIVVKYWDIAQGRWLETGISNIQIDAANGLLSFHTTHATIFGVFIEGEPVDSDGDGIPDGEDLCPGTLIPESVPTSGALRVNRWALTDVDGSFDTIRPFGGGPSMNFTIEDTGGCSCEQIVEKMGLGKDHLRNGCSTSAIGNWIEKMRTR